MAQSILGKLMLATNMERLQTVPQIQKDGLRQSAFRCMPDKNNSEHPKPQAKHHQTGFAACLLVCLYDSCDGTKHNSGRQIIPHHPC